jgi:hypothetical protein
MKMTRARVCAGYAHLQSATFRADCEIANNYANDDFNERDGNSGSDRDQTRQQRKSHPSRSDEPNVFEHKKTPSD